MNWLEIVISALITFAAVAAAIPVGLWIERMRAKEARKEQRRSVFRVLRRSFESNLETMVHAGRLVEQTGTDLMQVDTTWWHVVTGSDEAIDDPLLLKKIGQMYITLEQLNNCLRVWFETMSSPLAMAVDGWKEIDAAHRRNIGGRVRSALTQMEELRCLISAEP